MAHKKGLGSTKNGRDSNAQRLGIKKFGGESVKAGNIIARQRGRNSCPEKCWTRKRLYDLLVNRRQGVIHR